MKLQLSVNHTLFLLILLASLAIRLINIGEPFVYHREAGLDDAAFARQMVEQKDWRPFRVSGLELSKEELIKNYYLHWPLLPYFLLAATYSLFGISEWITRLFAVFFGLFNIWWIYRIGAKTVSISSGLIAACFMGMIPLTAYFDQTPSFVSLWLFGYLSTTYFYISWRASNHRLHFILFLTALFFALNSNWMAYSLLFVVSLDLIFFHKDKNRFKMAGIIISLGIVSVMTHFSLMYLATRDFSLTDELWHYGLKNRFTYSGVVGGITWTRLIHGIEFLTPVALLLTPFGLWLERTTLRQKMISHPLAFFTFVALLGWIFTPHLHLNHDYMLIYILPVVCISSSIVLVRLARRQAILASLLVFLFLSTSFLKEFQLFSNQKDSPRAAEAKMVPALGHAMNVLSTNHDLFVISPQYNFASLGFYSSRRILIFDNKMTLKDLRAASTGGDIYVVGQSNELEKFVSHADPCVLEILQSVGTASISKIVCTTRN